MDDEAFCNIPGMKSYQKASERERLFRLGRKWRAEIHEQFKKKMKSLSKQERAELGLELGLDFTTGNESFEVHSIRVSEKIGSLNNVQSQLILQVLQERKESTDTGETLRFPGGATLIVDQNTLEVRYSISKNVKSERRKKTMLQFLKKQKELLPFVYFRGTPFMEAGDRFAMLHREVS